MRVSTSAMQQSLITQMRNVQTQLNTASEQSTTGIKSTNYAGVADQAYVLTSLSAEISQASSYADLAENIQGRVDVYYDSLNSMTEVLTEMLTDISAAQSSGTGSVIGLNESARSALDTMATLLNSQYEGRYLYAGSATDTLPVKVDSTSYGAITTPSNADYSYYSGNSDVASAHVADGMNVEYGITADMDAFENALRALNIVANVSTDPIDTDVLAEATDLINSALDGIGEQQTRMSSVHTELESIIDMHTDFQLTAEGMVSDLSEVDIAEAMVRLDTLSVQLEASYSAVAKVADLSLFDYLH
ncbi:flagellin [Thalassospira marina]|uniref:Flagellin n=1 Tax=Thalassospira marina TaxID=2048283 RepID=A0A2N3KSU9_9PROT|nr:flagellin [Thalassospira marina]PKR53553.1 flagellar biosynthesis protein FlgL [Thalassospira marina]